MSVIVSAHAQADIDGATEDLTDAYGASVASAFQTRLADTLRQLDRHPLSAALVGPPYPKHPDLRRQTIRRFAGRVVYYVPTPTGIRVVRVLHSGQDADAVFG